MPIWILEKSKDNGATWRIEQPYHIYKDPANAADAVEKHNNFSRGQNRWKWRAAEYRPVVAA